MGDNSLACCCLTHGQLEIASSVTLWLCRMRARLHTTTWGWGKLMDMVGSAKGGRLQRHQKAGMHLWSAGCFLFMWKNPSKPNQRIPCSLTPPAPAKKKKKNTKTQTTQWTFGGVYMQKKLVFSLCLGAKEPIVKAKAALLRGAVVSFEQS